MLIVFAGIFILLLVGGVSLSQGMKSRDLEDLLDNLAIVGGIGWIIIVIVAGILIANIVDARYVGDRIAMYEEENGIVSRKILSERLRIW